MFGKKRVHSEETKQRIKNTLIGRKHSHSKLTKEKLRLARLGKKHTLQTIEKIRLNNSGKKSYWYGNHHSNITKLKLRNKRLLQIIPSKDTSIEVKIQNFLKQLEMEFVTHQYIKEIQHGYQCDILIPSLNLIIECDGDYWHHYPEGKEIDRIRTQELIDRGFKVMRLWEQEIKKMTLQKFKEEIENYRNITDPFIKQWEFFNKDELFGGLH